MDDCIHVTNIIILNYVKHYVQVSRENFVLKEIELDFHTLDLTHEVSKVEII